MDGQIPIINSFQFQKLHYVDETGILYCQFKSKTIQPDLNWLHVSSLVRIHHKNVDPNNIWRILSICFLPSKSHFVRGELLMSNNGL